MQPDDIFRGSLAGSQTGLCCTMRTPGRCTNLEGCWISASHRSVWLSVGEDFVCPNCGGNLSAPLPQTRSYRAVKRAAGFGAIASLSLAVAAFGAVELSKVSWPGQSVAAAVVRAPGALVAATFRAKPAPTQLAEAPEYFKPATTSDDRMAFEVARNHPNSATSMMLADKTGAHTPLPGRPPSGPLMLYKSHTDRAAAAPMSQNSDGRPGTDEQRADASVSPAHPPVVTLVSQTALAFGASMERPVVLPISFGRPIAPESDAEPVSTSWHHHGVVTSHHSGFLPAPAEVRQAAPDALAQICRIPSLMH